MIKNKKAQMEILYIFGAIFIVLVIGILILLFNPILQTVSDGIIPSVKDAVGTIPQTNISSASDVIFDAGSTGIHSLNWVFGVLFFVAIISIFGLAISYNISGSKILMGIWICLSIVLILTSFFVSNIVEDMANGGGDYGTGITNQSLLYFLLLNSPYIFIVVTFISGIIIFVGLGQEEQF